MMIVAGIVLLLGLIVFFAVRSQRQKHRKPSKPLSDTEIRDRIAAAEPTVFDGGEPDAGTPDTVVESTVFLGAETGEYSPTEGTALCEDETPPVMVTLTDISAVERRFQKPIVDSLLIGFSQDSDICVNYDRSVSRKHCELVKEGDDFYIINHSQSNGTLIDGVRIQDKTRVRDGNVIKMGRVELRLEISR